MLVAVPAAPRVAKMAGIGKELAQFLTNSCPLPFRMFLLVLPILNRFAALSHSAGFRAACKPLHDRGSEPKAIRL
jgi:hypothetical protein